MRGVLAAIFVLLVAGVCIRLGFWQLDRLEQRRARNAAIRAASARPPLAIDSAFASLAADPDAYAWRPVRVQGRYDPRGEVILRTRGHEGNPGVHVVTPLVLAGGRVVMVNRGWAPSPDAVTVNRAALRADTGVVAVEGVLQPITSSPDRGMPAAGRAGADTTWRRLDLASLRARLRGPVLPLYVQQLPRGAAADPPHPVPLPELGEGSHLSYAVQWFSFAAIAVIGFGAVAFRRKKA